MPLSRGADTRYNSGDFNREEAPLSTRHFPHTLYLVHHLPTNSFGCADAHGVRGLACFTHPTGARRFARRMETRRNLIVEVCMADACEVAAGTRLAALILADDADAPLIHHLPAGSILP